MRLPLDGRLPHHGLLTGPAGQRSDVVYGLGVSAEDALTQYQPGTWESSPLRQHKHVLAHRGRNCLNHDHVGTMHDMDQGKLTQRPSTVHKNMLVYT